MGEGEGERRGAQRRQARYLKPCRSTAVRRVSTSVALFDLTRVMYVQLYAALMCFESSVVCNFGAVLLPRDWICFMGGLPGSARSGRSGPPSLFLAIADSLPPRRAWLLGPQQHNLYFWCTTVDRVTVQCTSHNCTTFSPPQREQISVFYTVWVRACIPTSTRLPATSGAPLFALRARACSNTLI